MDPKSALRKRVRRWVSLALSSIALVLAPAAVSMAQTATGTPQAYKITFSVEFSSNGGTSYTGALTGKEFNIGTENVAGGGTAATFTVTGLSGSSFNRVKGKFTCATKMKGSVACTLAACNTTDTFFTTAGGGASTSGPAAEGTYTLTAGPCAGVAEATFESNVFDPPFRIGGTVVFTFDAAGSLNLNFTGAPPTGPVLSPGQFSVTMTTE